MEAIRAEIACNDVLLPRLRDITKQIDAAPDGSQAFNNYVQKFQTDPSPEAPPTQAAKKITYDEMLLSLMLQVRNEVKDKGVDTKDAASLSAVIVRGLEGHVEKLQQQQENIQQELAGLEKEKAKKITSEDLRDGWDSKVYYFIYKCIYD